jgi:hypothetical protein
MYKNASMIQMNDEELNLARRIWPILRDDQWSTFNEVILLGEKKNGGYSENKYGIAVKKDSKSSLVIVFRQMYDWDVEISHAQLQKLSELLNTININLGSPEGMNSGCDTCGHNGLHSIEIYIKDIDPEFL